MRASVFGEEGDERRARGARQGLKQTLPAARPGTGGQVMDSGAGVLKSSLNLHLFSLGKMM